MGGGAHSARWLDRQFGYHLEVNDVEGYSGDDWEHPDAERVDGREDTEGDNHSSVYAVVEDMEYLAYEHGWTDEEGH